jgi:hypothetical protein
MADDLETVLVHLLAAEINVWIATVPPGHISVRIHDANGGPELVNDFTADDAGSIGPWLLKTARRLYPDRFGGAKPPHPGLM